MKSLLERKAQMHHPVNAMIVYIKLFERFFCLIDYDDLHGSGSVLLNSSIVLWGLELKHSDWRPVGTMAQKHMLPCW